MEPEAWSRCPVMPLLTTAVASTLDPQGPAAAEIADLWWLMLVLGTVAFAIFAVLLGGGLVRGRVPSDHEFPEPEEGAVGRSWLLGGGVVLPTLLIVVVYLFTVGAMRGLYRVPTDALTIEVTGHQWWWEARYPESGFTTAGEIHIPVGRPIELRLISEDVIHSFWVPALAGKIDALPDRPNVLVIQADEPGTYRGQCAEFCGLQHAKMGLLVVAEPPDAFDSWTAQQRRAAAQPEDAEAVRGREVFLASACVECHTIRGTPANGKAGPDLTHLASRETIGATTLSNTRQHLIEWVSDPWQFKSGIAMPPSRLSPEELEALVSYLESLR